MSLLLSYLRFFQGRYYKAAVIIAVLCTMAHIAFLFVFIFTCTPVKCQSQHIQKETGSNI